MTGWQLTSTDHMLRPVDKAEMAEAYMLRDQDAFLTRSAAKQQLQG